MASSSANVEAPPTVGVQLTEGLLATEVPAGVFFPHPGALSCNAGAAALEYADEVTMHKAMEGRREV
jgi:hypothetical protein